MPANLTPQYFEAERKYKEATTPQEKIRALKEMFAVMPKHKGTDKLQGDIKRKISKLKEEIEHVKKSGARHTESISREGSGQVVVIGPPNGGRSSIVSALTHAEPEVAPYPFTTVKPQPAMMPYEDVQIQLVDMPPMTENPYEGWLGNVIRECDLVLLVVGLDDLDPDGALKEAFARLEDAGVALSAARPGDEDTADYRTIQKQAFVVINKIDLEGVDIMKGLIRPVTGDLPILEISCETGRGVEELRETVYRALDLIRVYTKAPGKKPDMGKPYVVGRGTTVIELAGQVHKDFRENLKFARIWGHAKFDGQQVEKEHILQDGDVIELHI
jgi:hypothetical protein